MKFYWGKIRYGYMTPRLMQVGNVTAFGHTSKTHFHDELFTWKLYGVVWGSRFLGYQRRLNSEEVEQCQNKN